MKERERENGKNEKREGHNNNKRTKGKKRKKCEEEVLGEREKVWCE